MFVAANGGQKNWNMLNKKTFLLNVNTLQGLFCSLTDAQIGVLMRRVVGYVTENPETIPTDEPTEAAFGIVRGFLDENDAKYRAKIHRAPAPAPPPAQNNAPAQNNTRTHAQNNTRAQNTISDIVNINNPSLHCVSVSVLRDAHTHTREGGREDFFNEIREYAKSRQKQTGINVDVDFFINYYEESNWHTASGEPIKYWKLTYLKWEKKEKRKKEKENSAKEKERRAPKNSTRAAYEEIKNEINAQFFGVSATNNM